MTTTMRFIFVGITMLLCFIASIIGMLCEKSDWGWYFVMAVICFIMITDAGESEDLEDDDDDKYEAVDVLKK